MTLLIPPAPPYLFSSGSVEVTTSDALRTSTFYSYLPHHSTFYPDPFFFFAVSSLSCVVASLKHSLLLFFLLPSTLPSKAQIFDFSLAQRVCVDINPGASVPPGAQSCRLKCRSVEVSSWLCVLGVWVGCPPTPSQPLLKPPPLPPSPGLTLLFHVATMTCIIPH